ncbi:S5A REDUCTASE domain-containing protein [Citrus sinensis]|uniref:3-oxo-5-alpha-steroid 4-dehydrogenase C-terminal domain-containing protein n=2 Tax=Citrus TaxID=2706 RepID=A0A2H5PVQ8_CITUN|nr:very-long-chain enoyl-CoA reductase [Citrus x clementina]XP_006485519.1 uncharacterized protein LOC102617880 [Citrus sinensis]XP_006485520.1 uncharacterized protein LOC102617880 [Citrus sinensis]XP_024957164.1 uncharacterized protein LOC102617880 [Citrus sinensis]XP_052295660.1 uncharacterized protein LOC102617880 [Citrus sinensis]XP_052295661.1 uncharacterized protein LOC102617880 [Citrus sinensis]GAY56457.1 hypothetical protein CUMW_172040 [Citrus unshiu]ESR59056.1 hypothetical protein 
MFLITSIFSPLPPSLFIKTMCVVNVVTMANLGYSEIKGKHLKYSKFWNFNSDKSSNNKEIKLSAKTGMLFLYTPSFLAGLASFWLFPHEGFRFMLLTSALTVHFFKRIVEVLFIHKYSSGMVLDSAIVISLSYLISTAAMIYVQSEGLGEPTIDLKFLGMILFLLGISGNFYHHNLLSKMRRNGEKEYKIPTSGLFDKVVCPHYLFEILGFWGIFFIAQTLYAFCYAIGVTFYLMGRSYATRAWYLSKFEDFPKHVNSIFPYIF